MSTSMDESNNNNDTQQDYYRLLLPQALVGLVDAISMMVVAPSIVFYVLELGGTKEQYGIILSAFSLASFLFKPVFGYWCDQSGYKFRLPYLVSIAVACSGGLLYFVASAFSTSQIAIACLLTSRILGGVGAANNTLGFTYVAQVVPHKQMTKFSALLSMVRVLGMTLAPGMNYFLNFVDTSIGSFQVTPLNSVGLFLFVANAASFLVIYGLLEEPPDSTKPTASPVGADKCGSDFYKSVLRLNIILPMLNILLLNANFQLLETGLAPAASHVLGWNPVSISALFGFNSVLIFGLIVVTFQLSHIGVLDEHLLITGLICSIIGYGLLYFCWHVGAGLLEFVGPVVIATSAFPFLGAPTRSMFTKSVASDPILGQQQGTMQAAMSMAASVAGFVAPGLIAAFVLRTPDEVAASQDKREFTAWALYAPITSAGLLAGFVYLSMTTPEPKEEEDEELKEAAETTALLGGLLGQRVPAFHPRTEAYRRHSVTLMGIPQISFHQEQAKKSSRRHTVAI